jgi:hypothetical protein
VKGTALRQQAALVLLLLLLLLDRQAWVNL